MSRTAVIIPCLNEAVTVAQVVHDVRDALPDADIVVVDNGSTDGTAGVARLAGARVLVETRPGKGAALRRAFHEVQADVWVLLDGDGTYAAQDAVQLILLLQSADLDVVNGARVPVGAALRPTRSLGNRWFSAGLRLVFDSPFRDPLSGYKVLSERFVASFPSVYDGFEVETELVVHAVRSGARCSEQDTVYRCRPEGSHSKLSALRDGLRIAWAMFELRRG
ncbi:MAG: glycosyltransferase involved in cell wall biosynthesis [Myxococcota bacterium]|jgi:glycosyltransferase involved in cell wall biosynthesis